MNGAWLIASRAGPGRGRRPAGGHLGRDRDGRLPAPERGRALGINVMAVYLGLSVGPPLGGLLVDHFGWRWIFFVNMPIGIAALRLGLAAAAAQRTRRQSGRMRPNDLAGPASGRLLVCLLVPLTFAPQWGWAAPRTVVLLAVSAASLAAFVFTELRARTRCSTSTCCSTTASSPAANTAALLNYMALVCDQHPDGGLPRGRAGPLGGLTGWLMLAQPVVMALLSPLAGRLSDRFGSRLLSTTGMVIVAAGMVLLATMPITAAASRV